MPVSRGDAPWAGQECDLWWTGRVWPPAGQCQEQLILPFDPEPDWKQAIDPYKPHKIIMSVGLQGFPAEKQHVIQSRDWLKKNKYFFIAGEMWLYMLLGFITQWDPKVGLFVYSLAYLFFFT